MTLPAASTTASRPARPARPSSRGQSRVRTYCQQFLKDADDRSGTVLHDKLFWHTLLVLHVKPRPVQAFPQNEYIMEHLERKVEMRT